MAARTNPGSAGAASAATHAVASCASYGFLTVLQDLYKPTRASQMLNSCFNETAQRCGLVFANKTPLAKESYAVCTAAGNSPRSHVLSTGFTFGGTRRRSGAETARTYSNEQSIAHLSRRIHSTAGKCPPRWVGFCIIFHRHGYVS